MAEGVLATGLAVLQISAQEGELPLFTANAEAMEGTSVLSKIAKQAIQTVISLFFQKRFMLSIISDPLPKP